MTGAFPWRWPPPRLTSRSRDRRASDEPPLLRRQPRRPARAHRQRDRSTSSTSTRRSTRTPATTSCSRARPATTAPPRSRPSTTPGTGPTPPRTPSRTCAAPATPPPPGCCTAMRSFLGENDMMAYLVMMAVRLLELHRVLKPTGSLYLHCDPTASHYLKMLLDAVFGPRNYRNEIIWKRQHFAQWHMAQEHYGRLMTISFSTTRSRTIRILESAYLQALTRVDYVEKDTRIRRSDGQEMAALRYEIQVVNRTSGRLHATKVITYCRIRTGWAVRDQRTNAEAAIEKAAHFPYKPAAE